MRIISSTADGVTVLEVIGEVDLATADDLRDAGIKALTPFGGTLRIDLSRVTFMDSTALGALIAIRNAAGNAHHVVIQNPQPSVRKVLAITGLDHIFGTDHTSAVLGG